MFPDFDLNIIIDLFGRRRQPAPPRDDQDAAKFPDSSVLGALPFPQPVPVPPPTGVPLPPSQRPPVFDFPRLPGANDPIFRKALTKRLLGLGGLLIDLEVLIIRELNKRQDKRATEIIREQDRVAAEAGVRGAESRAQRERDLRVTTQVEALLGAPETFDPTPSIPAPRPGAVVMPTTLPDLFPIALPFPSTLPGPASVPQPGDVAAPQLPEPVSPTPDSPLPLPTSVPLPFPLGFPAPIPAPIEVPFTDPLTLFDPPPVPSGGVPDTLPFTGPGFEPLTGFQPTPQPNAQLNPDRCPRRKCDDDLDDPRVECFKGLYKEGRFDTDFTSWTPIDCETGRELADNVIPFGR